MMKLLLIACSLFVVASPCGHTGVEPLNSYELNADGTIRGRGVRQNTHGIVNGDIAKTHSLPWQVMIHADGSMCGGTIISRDWVLTAAHCIGSKSGGKYKMYFGMHDSQAYESNVNICHASRVITHGSYNDRTKANDIALLRIDHNSCSKTFMFTRKIQPACLPEKSDVFSNEDVFALVSGWGTTTEGGSVSRRLRKTVVQMHELSECDRMYRTPVNYGGIAKGSLCASGVNSKGKTDSCQGDSGGPLVVRTKAGVWKLAGVVSYGAGCAAANLPGVYADVPYFLDWIKGYTGF